MIDLLNIKGKKSKRNITGYLKLGKKNQNNKIVFYMWVKNKISTIADIIGNTDLGSECPVPKWPF